MNAVLEHPTKRHESISDAVMIPVGLIQPNPWNRHINEKGLADIAESVRKHGVLQPVLVRPLDDATPGQPVYELIAGERRWRASQIAERKTLPALVRRMDDLEVIELMLVENLEREDLHELDEAAGYDRLLRKDSGPQSLRGFASVEELAERIGKSRSYIVQRLKLLQLETSARDAFRRGELTFSLALRIARLPDPKDQVKATSAILKGWGGQAMSARDADDYIHRTFMLSLSHAAFKITDASLVPDAGNCKDCSKRTGSNPDLFGDIASGDTCTDAACFQAKETAHRERIKAEAESRGMEVISGTAARKLKPQAHSDTKGLLMLDKVHYNLDDKKPLRKLLGSGSEVKPVLFECPHTHELVEMVPTEQATAVLKASGVIKSSKLPATSASTRADDLKRKREMAWRQAVAEECITAAKGEAGQQPGYRTGLILQCAMLLWREMSHEACTRLSKLLGWPPLQSSWAKGPGLTVDQHFAALSDAELCGFLTAARVVGEIHIGSYQSPSAAPSQLLATAADLGVNVDAIKEAQRQLQREPAAKKKAGPTPETALAGAMKKATAKKPAKPPVKYRSPMTHETWSGRGLQPAWLKAALAAGAKLSDFLVDPQPGA